MELSALTALSPLDGRYAKKMMPLRDTLSEYGLIKQRLHVEIQWLITLCQLEQLPELRKLSASEVNQLTAIEAHFNLEAASRIKTIEATTNHDVKAVEYYIRQHLEPNPQLQHLVPFIHFACTSEDINNLAYGLMLKEARQNVLLPSMQALINDVDAIAKALANQPLLSRTHGQAATPTTMGKEFANVALRLERQCQQFSANPILGKCNGAVGNFNAHYAAYPELNWPQICQQFVESLGLQWNPLTTQIEPHDAVAEYLQTLTRFNTILIDLNRDIWSYISNGFFKQKTIQDEVGSSTMPHKVNPIDFENSEGNLGIANALCTHLANKLPISRWQRDLTDSTVLRNLSLCLGYSELAYQSARKGLSKLEANPEQMLTDLNAHPEVLAEAIQTVMRRHGIADAYEQLKAFTRGQPMNTTMLSEFIDQLQLAAEVKAQLQTLTVETYLGCASELAQYLIK